MQSIVLLNISEHACLTNTNLRACIVWETPGTDRLGLFSLVFCNCRKSVFLALGSTSDTAQRY